MPLRMSWAGMSANVSKVSFAASPNGAVKRSLEQIRPEDGFASCLINYPVTSVQHLRRCGTDRIHRYTIGHVNKRHLHNSRSPTFNPLQSIIVHLLLKYSS